MELIDGRDSFSGLVLFFFPFLIDWIRESKFCAPLWCLKTSNPAGHGWLG